MLQSGPDGFYGGVAVALSPMTVHDTFIDLAVGFGDDFHDGSANPTAEHQMQTQPFTGMMPSQFDIVQLVYDEIVRAPWFHDTEATREECSVMVLQQYRKGHAEQDDLRRECVAIARQRYAA